MSHIKDSGLRYFLSENRPILVITLLGRIDQFTIDALINCKTEIAGYDDIKYVVFYCRDVEAITEDAIDVLVQIQSEIRARSCALNFSALKPVLREQLLAAGIIRPDEVSNNMQGAISGFSPDAMNVKKVRVSGHGRYG